MAFIKCQYTDDYLLTFLLPTSGLSLLICLVLFPGSFLCKLPAVSHVFFLWDIPACFLPYSISFSSSYLPLFFRIISSMLYLGKRVYASFIDLLELIYSFQLYFIGSDPKSFCTASFTDAFLPSSPHSTSIRLALRRLCYRRCLITGTFLAASITATSQCLSKR